MCSWGYGELALRDMSHGLLRYLARDSYLKDGSFERLQEKISWANEDRCKRSIEMIANNMVSSDLHFPHDTNCFVIRCDQRGIIRIHCSGPTDIVLVEVREKLCDVVRYSHLG